MKYCPDCGYKLVGIGRADGSIGLGSDQNIAAGSLRVDGDIKILNITVNFDPKFFENNSRSHNEDVRTFVRCINGLINDKSKETGKRIEMVPINGGDYVRRDEVKRIKSSKNPVNDLAIKAPYGQVISSPHFNILDYRLEQRQGSLALILKSKFLNGSIQKID